MLKEDRLIRDNIKDFRLLLEYVDRNTIIDSINNRNVLKIYYAGDETVNRGWRTIEPYAIGTHVKTGNVVIRAWQQAGATDTPTSSSRNDGIRDSPGGAWRMFRIDGVTSALPYPNKHFAEKGVRPGYRKDGEDSHMTTIFAAVVASEKDDMPVDLKGISSYTDPDVVGTKQSKFDPQAQKMKQFYQDPSNQEEILKRRVSDFYTMLKQNGKDPARYDLINKDGKYWYQKVGTRNHAKLKDDEIIGNMNKLYRKYSGARGFKIDKNFQNKERQGFENLLRKSGGL